METKIILAIDPGDLESAYVLFDPTTEKILESEKIKNETLLKTIDRFKPLDKRVAIEMLSPYGTVGAEIIDTAVWIGRFMERLSCPVDLLFRKTIVSALLKNPQANDTHVRHYLVDRYGNGNPRTRQKGTILEGIYADCWQALAIAVVVSDKMTGRFFAGRTSLVKKEFEI